MQKSIWSRATDLKARIKVRQCHIGESDVGEGGEGPGEAEVDDDADHPVAHTAHLLQDAALPGGQHSSDCYRHQ